MRRDRPGSSRPVVAALAFLLATQALAQEPTVRHDYATVNGIRLHYAHTGSGDLILFLHGFPEFWYAWKDQLAYFGRNHLAVAPDLRGYNLSDKPAGLEAYRVTPIVEDIRALGAKLGGGKPFVLVGHDWGGVIAWATAITHPEMVKRLVIVNAPHPGVFNRELNENPEQQRASRYMLFFRSPEAEHRLADSNYRTLVGFFDELRAAGKFTDRDRDAYLEAWRQPGALTGGLNYYRASRVGPPVDGRRDSLEIGAGAPRDLTVTVPTLVIWGEKDTALLPGNLVGLDRYVNRLTIERIPTGTHWVIHEEPDRINRLIEAFLAK
jgi:pimeloyl-ACP methyl ester carboxylesterase